MSVRITIKIYEAETPFLSLLILILIRAGGSHIKGAIQIVF